jgi:hypothetical protein
MTTVMSSIEQWKQSTLEALQACRQTLDAKTRKRLQLDLLQRAVLRVAELSEQCSECHRLQGELMEMACFPSRTDHASKSEMKTYRKKLRGLTEHLHKAHKLLPSGTYIGLGIVLGTAIGISLGSIMENIGTGIAIGTGMGVAIGSGLEARAKREGRIL